MKPKPLPRKEWERLNNRLARLEVSMARMDSLPAREVDAGEYGRTLTQIVSLRRRVGGRAPKRKKIKPRRGRCSSCGCTETTPCAHANGTPCGWANSKHTLCTACANTVTRWPESKAVLSGSPEGWGI